MDHTRNARRPLSPPAHSQTRSAGRLFVQGSLLSIALLAGACAGPLERSTSEGLGRSITSALQAELAEAERYAAPRMLSREDRLDTLGIRADHLEQIEQEYSVAGYIDSFGNPFEGAEAGEPTGDTGWLDELLGEDLLGQQHSYVAVGLRRAVVSALANNLDVAVARFGPAIAETEVVAAEAVFDWQFSTALTWTDVDSPQPGPGFLDLPSVVQSEQTVESETSLSRSLTSGATVGVTQRLTYRDERQSAFGAVGSPDPASTAAFDFELNQPLMRGFGRDANLAEVRIAQNAERSQISTLRGALESSLTDVEDAYWDLVTAYAQLVIQARLVQRGIEVRDDIRARLVQDARPAQVADAVARVERRKGDLLRVRNTLRRASDRVKRLMNDPELPVGSEALLVPTDRAIDAPVEISLAEAIATAVRQRPELERALLSIDDATIRTALARNAALPRLDLQASLTLIGFGEDFGDAYDTAGDNEFVDNFVLGAIFSQAIGNRAGEANARAARLRRLQSATEYRRSLQAVVIEVKAALDDVDTNYRLIEQARLGRVAQGEALRTLQVEKELTDRGYTVERLNVELNNQESLAGAEIEEINAMVDYNRALARLALATGSTLERNRVDFVVPDANQVEAGERAIDYRLDADAD
ncbi:MAG: TolC family protein [Planctomycetota bacterium]